MAEFIAVMMITILAVISPGADFAIVTKNSYLYGRRVGIFTSLGIALGVLLHVAYILIAVTLVLTYTPQILNVIKYLGAIYLIYIGFKTCTQKPISDEGVLNTIKPTQAFKYGFFTNALNPKTCLFVMSTYTQIVSITTPKIILMGYGIFMSFVHLLWFSMVAFIFSSLQLRQKMLTEQVKINRIIGTVLCLLGGILLFANIQ